jgi:hypothetical protein
MNFINSISNVKALKLFNSFKNYSNIKGIFITDFNPLKEDIRSSVLISNLLYKLFN